MKKLLVLIVAVFAYAGVAMAQGPMQMDPKEMAKFMTEHMVDQYDLNKDQEAKVLEVNKEFSKEMFSSPMNFMEMGDEERQAFMAKMQKLTEARDKKFKEILTPEQYEKYQKQQEEMRNGGGF
jgi:Spy/CpxP family protein refolding chaperone